jgi:hypothetical protein
VFEKDNEEYEEGRAFVSYGSCVCGFRHVLGTCGERTRAGRLVLGGEGVRETKEYKDRARDCVKGERGGSQARTAVCSGTYAPHPQTGGAGGGRRRSAAGGQQR